MKDIPCPSLENNLTVIIPVYNEAGVIEDVVRGMYDRVVRKVAGARFIVAEDGSTDGTKEILAELQKTIPFELMAGSRRKGYTRAFKEALTRAGTDFVFFCDSDGQHDPEDFFKLCACIAHADIVGGYKSPRRDPWHRLLLSRGYNGLVRLIFGLKTRDIDSGFKLIRKKVVDDIMGNVGDFRCCVMSEFVIKAYLSGYKIAEVAVSHFPRQSGATSLFPPQRLPGIILRVLRDLYLTKRYFVTARRKVPEKNEGA